MSIKKSREFPFLFSVLLYAVILVHLLAPGCRDPLFLPADTHTDTDLHFDASVGDGGTGTLCGANPETVFNNTHSPYFGGDESVDVVVVHFSNFGCSHCAGFAKDTKMLWERRPDFQKQVRIYFHHFVFSSDFNWQQHQTAVAAGNQGMEYFWAVHDRIYDGMLEHEYLSVEDLHAYVRDTLMLDMTRFDADFNAAETKAFLQWEISEAENAGVRGTPAVFLCGKVLSNRSELEEKIDELLGD